MRSRIQSNGFLLLLGFCGQISLASAALPPACVPGFSSGFSANTISSDDWDETAVRKVMHTFAYGGFATDQQIKAWADMASPECAIQEILTFQPTNDLLSPPGTDSTYDNVQTYLVNDDGDDATLESLQTFWSSDSIENPEPDTFRYNLISGNNLKASALSDTWISATNKHGVNPFRQKVGFWLTNYQMSVHMQAVGNNPVIIRKMYDDVMRLLSEDEEGDNIDYFADILSTGAKSPAIAVQYGHKDNRYSGNVFKGNDDFAREYHQLFFGILGEADKADYEDVTVENTARMFTGLTVGRSKTYYTDASNPTTSSFYHDVVSYDFTRHHPDTLDDLVILGNTISSASYPTANDKIDAVSHIAINDSESENNLPVWIIKHFADDTLSSEVDDSKTQDIRSAWMNSNKNLLHFLRSYAISDQFHQKGNFQAVSRYKYKSSFDRNMSVHNLNTLDNEESYLHPYANPKSRMEAEGAKAFYPSHFVFGGQTGLDAANNPDIFKTAYNRNVGHSEELYKTSSGSWKKAWADVIPAEYANANGEYRVGDIGAWLWNRFIADGGTNYGTQERFYVAGILANGNNFDPGDGYTESELDPGDALANASAIIALETNEDVLIKLDESSTADNEHVGLAISFIATTPYAFVQLGSNVTGGQ